MRRLLIVGAVSLASALAVSCGDDSGDGGGSAGTGGAGGSGGASGNGGSAGASGGNGGSAGASGGNGGSSGASGGSAGASGGSAGSSAGSSGAAGNGTVDPDGGLGDASTGDAGDGGGPPPCTGCVELRVPLTASLDFAYFQIGFTPRSLADTVFTFRVRALALDPTGETYVHTFASDSDFTQASGTQTLINAANFTDTNTFIDLTLDFNTFSNVDFDEADVVALGLQVGAGGALAGPTTTVLVVDSLTLTGSSGLPNLTFTDSAEGLAPNAFAGLQTTTLLHHPE